MKKLKQQNSIRKKKTLQKIQKDFLYSLINPLNKNTTNKSHHGLSIYISAYRIRLLESLKSDFSITEKALGRKVFENICKEYIYKSPSRFHDLLDYSHQLPRFVEKNKKWMKSWPWIKDLLIFEERLNLAALSSNERTFPPKNLSLKTKIQLSPSLKIFKSSYGLETLFLSKKKNPPRKTSYFRISNLNEKAIWAQIPKEEYQFLDSIIKHKKPISIEILSSLNIPMSQKQITEIFAEWTTNHLITFL